MGTPFEPHGKDARLDNTGAIRNKFTGSLLARMSVITSHTCGLTELFLHLEKYKSQIPIFK